MSFLLLFVSCVLFVNMFCINLISILNSYENIVHNLLVSVPKNAACKQFMFVWNENIKYE